MNSVGSNINYYKIATVILSILVICLGYLYHKTDSHLMDMKWRYEKVVPKEGSEFPGMPSSKEDLSPFMLIKVIDKYGNEVDKDYKGEGVFSYKGINSLDFSYNSNGSLVEGDICFEALNIDEISPTEKPYGKQIRNYFCTAMTRKLLTDMGKDWAITKDLGNDKVLAKDFEGGANFEVSGYDIVNLGTSATDWINISKVNEVYR